MEDISQLTAVDGGNGGDSATGDHTDDNRHNRDPTGSLGGAGEGKDSVGDRIDGDPDSRSGEGRNKPANEPCPQGDRISPQPSEACPQGDRTHPLSPLSKHGGGQTHPPNEQVEPLSNVSSPETHLLKSEVSPEGGEVGSIPDRRDPSCPEKDCTHPPFPEADRDQTETKNSTPNSSRTDSDVKGVGMHGDESLGEDEDVLFDVRRNRAGSVPRTASHVTEATNGISSHVIEVTNGMSTLVTKETNEMSSHVTEATNERTSSRVTEGTNGSTEIENMSRDVGEVETEIMSRDVREVGTHNGLQNGPSSDDSSDRHGDGCIEPVGEVEEGVVSEATKREDESVERSNEARSSPAFLLAQVQLLEEKNAELVSQIAERKEKEASFQEIARELESKCFHQQERIEELEEEQDRKVLIGQQQERELLLKVDQVSRQCEDADKDKASVIGKLAVLQEEQRRLIDQVTDRDKRVKELTKETEKLDVLVKKQRAEVLKLQGSLEKAEARSNQLTQELSKEKSEVSSLNIKVKWAQNKLKTETEAHKNVKSQLEAAGKKLKQAEEEGGQIRAAMKEMIQQYQESEDMRSNSLDIKLKKTERELKQQEQEIADQQDLHDLTVKELELSKASHKIAQEEVQHHKQKLTELNGRLSELIAEIEEQKGTIAKQKQENKKLTSELSELEQRTQGFDKERVKFTQLREVFTQLQKSNQHLEKELERKKEREAELLTFSANLSSSNAELTAERSDWEAKVTSLGSERDALSKWKEQETRLREELKTAQETSQAEIASLLDKLDGKTKAVEQLSMSLEDERELVKAVKKKNTNVIKDLQKQLQSSNRRIESLEASISSDREPPATLPISRTSSHSSLDGVMGTSAPPPTTSSRHVHAMRDTPLTLTTANEDTITGAPATISLSDEERAAATPSPEYKFSIMDQEKIMLVEKMCQLKKELVKQEEKAEFFEEHIAQLTEEIQGKSRIIQNFIMREQTGALAPPSFDANKVRQVQKGGVMGTVFSGKNSRAYKMPEVNYELSLEMNKKMQSVLEDTLLKNIQLKENIDTLGREIQRISAQLQTYEKLKQ